MHRHFRHAATTLIVLLTLLATTGSMRAEDSVEPETRHKMIHKVVIDCDEDSPEGCEDEVHVKVLSGDHTGTVGDHSMIWVGDGKHRRHISVHGGPFGEGGFLGVQLTDLTPELRAHFGVSEDEGVMVSKVIDDSAAFRAGLQAGDIITRVDAESIGSAMDLMRAIRSQDEGESVTLEVWRDGSYSTFEATLEQRDWPIAHHRAFFVDCDDDQGDCEIDLTTRALHGLELDCPEGEDCKVEIRCSAGDCECTSNGESIDCPELHGMHHGH